MSEQDYWLKSSRVVQKKMVESWNSRGLLRLEEALLICEERPLHRGQWHRYQVWSRAVASKNPLCALKSGQPSCHWGTCHWCGGSQRFKALSTNATYKSTHCSSLSRHFSLKPIYTTYGPQRSHLSTPPQGQGFWDKWLIRVAVLFLTTKKRKTNDFFKCFICYTGKYNLSP